MLLQINRIIYETVNEVMLIYVPDCSKVLLLLFPEMYVIFYDRLKISCNSRIVKLSIQYADH